MAPEKATPNLRRIQRFSAEMCEWTARTARPAGVPPWTMARVRVPGWQLPAGLARGVGSAPESSELRPDLRPAIMMEVGTQASDVKCQSG